MREELQNMRHERDNLNEQLLDQSRSLDEKDQELANLLNIPKEEKASGNSLNATARDNSFWQEAQVADKVTAGSNRAEERSPLTPF